MTTPEPRSRASARRHAAYFAGVVALGFVVDLVALVIAVGG